MAKVKYDVSDVEVSDRNYAQPTPGIYTIKLVEANPRLTDGKNDIEAIVEVVDKGEFEGARIWSYVNFGEASRWKLREFTDAFELPPKGEIDTTKIIGKKCQIKVNAGSYEGDYRARLQRWLPLSDSVDGTDESDDDYNTWELDDLKAEVEERELEISGRATKAKLISALETDDGASSEDDSDEDNSDDAEPNRTAGEASGDGENYSEWELGELKEEAETRGILGNIEGRKTATKLVAALEADDAGPQGKGGKAEDDSEPEDDYDEWSVDELTAEIKDRELDMPKGRKTEDKLIAVLREDDNTDAF